MKFDILYNIGDQIKIGWVVYKIKGIHLYITGTGEIKKYRIYVGNNKFITVKL